MPFQKAKLIPIIQKLPYYIFFEKNKSGFAKIDDLVKSQLNDGFNCRGGSRTALAGELQ